MNSALRFLSAFAAVTALMSRLRCALGDKIATFLVGLKRMAPRPSYALIRHVGPVLLALLGPALVLAVPIPTSFRGVTTVLPTGNLNLSFPYAATVDTQGRVFIADASNDRVVEVNADGTTSVLGFPGLSPALGSPRGLAVDGLGNLYVADGANSRVVELSGGVASVVPTAALLISPGGLVIDAAGDIFIVDNVHSYIVEVPAGGGTAAVLSITGLTTALYQPFGLAIDSSGNLYVADTGNNRIVEIAPGGVGSVFAITGGLTLSQPLGVAVDNLGNVYVADFLNSRVVSVAPGGSGSVLYQGSASLSFPRGVAISTSGAVYIVDTGNNRVLETQPATVGFGHLPLGTTTGTTLTLPFTIDSSTTIGSLQAYTLGTPNLDFTIVPDNSCPNGAQSTNCGAPVVTCDAGVTNTSCNVVVQFLPTAAGLRRGAVVLYDQATPPNPILSVPLQAFSDSPLAALAPNTGSVINAGGLTLSNPFQLALDGAGNIYVGDYSGKNVIKISAGGGSASVVTLGTPGGTALQNITGIAIDGTGNLFIGDHQNRRILVVTPGGVVSVLNITGLSLPLGFPAAAGFDGAGNFYISDFTNGRIIRVCALVVTGSTSSGRGMVIGTGTFAFAASTLTGMTVDAQGNIYAAARTQNSSSIIKVTPAGVASALSFPGVTPAISNPQGVGVDAMGNVYVVDTGNNRIVRLTTAGVASVLRINGLPNPSSLGSLLFGVSLDPSGNLYIPDWTNNRVVYVNVSGASLAFANTKQGSTSSDSPKTATVSNLGNQALLFAADPTYTADFSQAPAGANQCLSGTNLAPGIGCNVSAQFTPQSVGTLSSGIVATDDAFNVSSSTQVISVSGIGLISGDTTAVSVSANPTTVGVGQALTVSAVVTDTASGHTATVPTGSVTFSDLVGSTAVSLNGGNPVALVSGTAVLTGVQLSGAGLHTITANYGGVTSSFQTSINTTTLTVTKNTEVIAGPTTQPVPVVVGQAGSVPVTVTGPYAGSPTPSGTLTYSVLNSSSVSVAAGSATLTAGETSSAATIPIVNSLTAGTYTVSVTYAGDSNYYASEGATTIQVLIAQITPTVSWLQPSGITYGTTLSGRLDASAANGETSVPGSFAYRATLQGGSPFSVTNATVLDGGSYTLTVTFTPTDTIGYTTATGTVSLTVAPASDVVSLASSATTIALMNPVTFTATVFADGGTPTGSLSFYDGTTSLGSGTIAGGLATYTTSSLSTGVHTITAQYGGSADFVPLTSSPLTETVADFSLNISSGGTSSATVMPGGTATYALVVGPASETNFPAAVNLSVTGLPPGATATITPSTLAADAGATNVSLTVVVPAQIASLGHRQTLAILMLPMMLGMLTLPFTGNIRRSAGKLGPFALLLFLVLVGTSLASLTGCASKSSGFLGKSQTSYTLTVTGTSGALSHSTTLNLTVQ